MVRDGAHLSEVRVVRYATGGWGVGTTRFSHFYPLSRVPDRCVATRTAVYVPFTWQKGSCDRQGYSKTVRASRIPTCDGSPPGLWCEEPATDRRLLGCVGLEGGAGSLGFFPNAPLIALLRRVEPKPFVRDECRAWSACPRVRFAMRIQKKNHPLGCREIMCCRNSSTDGSHLNSLPLMCNSHPFQGR